MTDILKHRFSSAKADGSDAGQVQPSHWNDGHKFQGGALGDLLQRDTADPTFGAKWASAAWIIPAFVATDYFVNIGTGTWPMTAGAINYCAYTIIGRTLFWNLGVSAVPFTGSPIGLSRKPFSAHQIGAVIGGLYMLQPAIPAYYQVASGAGSQVNFFKDVSGTAWVPGVDNAAIRAQGFYEIVG